MTRGMIFMLPQSALCWSVVESNCSFDWETAIIKTFLVFYNIMALLYLSLNGYSMKDNTLPNNPSSTCESLVQSTSHYLSLPWLVT